MPGNERTEDEQEEQRERYQELLQELRIILPGVQVLLAFLLAVPFAAGFDEVDDLGRNVFAVVILGVAVATTVLLAPAAYHRVAPSKDRADRLRFGVVVTVVGLGLLAVSMAAAIFVVVRYVFDSTALGLTFAGVVVASVVTLWFAVPFVQRE